MRDTSKEREEGGIAGDGTDREREESTVSFRKEEREQGKKREKPENRLKNGGESWKERKREGRERRRGREGNVYWDRQTVNLKGSVSPGFWKGALRCDWLWQGEIRPHPAPRFFKGLASKPPNGRALSPSLFPSLPHPRTALLKGTT